jgi:hypothetical protein
MKTKLLKKVRKRFDIIHMPKGFESCGDVYEFNLYKLVDNDAGTYTINNYAQLGRKMDAELQFCGKDHIFDTEEECIDYLKNLMIKKLRREGYRNRKDTKLNSTHKKVWYN